MALADFDLSLLGTINIPDSVRIKQVGSACDFNGDGYPDLFVSVYYNPSPRSQVVYFYYGGPDFDTEVDIIFTDGFEPGAPEIGFGEQLCPLGDMNGDGYDDIAIAAPM
jgi:hypothetical protein